MTHYEKKGRGGDNILASQNNGDIIKWDTARNVPSTVFVPALHRIGNCTRQNQMKGQFEIKTQQDLMTNASQKHDGNQTERGTKNIRDFTGCGNIISWGG